MALPLYGGMTFPSAMGAVVLPFCGFHTPDSGHRSPVRAVVPMGARAMIGRSWWNRVSSSKGHQSPRSRTDLTARGGRMSSYVDKSDVCTANRLHWSTPPA